MDGWSGRSLGGVDGEGEAPEVVGVAVLVAGDGDGDASVRSGDALRFAEVFAELGVDGMPDALGLVEVHEAVRQKFRRADIADLRLSIVDWGKRGARQGWKRDGGGEVEAADAVAEALMGVFEKAEA